MIYPQGSRLLITISEKKEEKVSGIILPDTAVDNSKVKRGEVVEVGRYVKFISKLNTVYFNILNTETVSDGNTEYVIVKESDILAINVYDK